MLCKFYANYSDFFEVTILKAVSIENPNSIIWKHLSRWLFVPPNHPLLVSFAKVAGKSHCTQFSKKRLPFLSIPFHNEMRHESAKEASYADVHSNLSD